MNKDRKPKQSVATMPNDDDSSGDQGHSATSKIDESSKYGDAGELPAALLRSTSSGNAADRPSVQFPWRLHELLTESETNGNESIISWIPGTNNCFKVHSKDKFTNEILPSYFNATKYKSFQRNLNLWGFESITEGPNKGGCQHPIFIRGDREKCHYMTRHKVRGQKQKQKGEMSDESNRCQTDEEAKSAPLPAMTGDTSAANLHLHLSGLQNLADVKSLSFCEKLHRILAVPELQGCIRWTSDGRCIAVLNPYQYSGFLFSTYFPNTTFSSFLGELERYGFQKIAHAGLQDCYYHDLMIQGCQHLCRYLATPEAARRFQSEDPRRDLQYGQLGSIQAGNPSQAHPSDPSIQHLLQLQQSGFGSMLQHSDALSGLALASIGGRRTQLSSLNSPLALPGTNLQNRSALLAYLADMERRGVDHSNHGGGRGAHL